MGLRHCEVEGCEASWYQHTGRPAKRCPEHQKNDPDRHGSAHHMLRAATIDQAYGQPCSRCGRPMLPGQPLHLDHVDGGAGDQYRPGLYSHASCNQKAANSRAAKWARAHGIPIYEDVPVIESQCGSWAGRLRHQLNGTKVCVLCETAEGPPSATPPAKKMTPFVIVDGACTQEAVPGHVAGMDPRRDPGLFLIV